MDRAAHPFAWTIAAVVASVVLSCSGRSEVADPPIDAASITRVEILRTNLLRAWDHLDSLCAEAARMDANAHPTPAEAARRSELEHRLTQARAAFDTAYGADQTALTGFLNVSLRTRPGSAETLSAMTLYAASAVRYARDVIDQSGDYRRAVDLLETARGYFDDGHTAPPAVLADALRRAQEFRVVTRARFAQLATGMTPAEVKTLVGVPFSGNVHQTEVGGKMVTSWLYGSEENSVTALYFDDRERLYAWKWDVMGSE